MSEIFVKSYFGLGDNVYIRPIIVDLCRLHETVYVETPWPQLLWDMDNIKFVKSKTKLRTQKKNIGTFNDWEYTPVGIPCIRPRYSTRTAREGKNPLRAFEDYHRPLRFDFSLPTDPWDAKAELMSRKWGDFALVRPCTSRQEWEAPARNCDPYYIEQCCHYLEGEGIKIVEIADLAGDEEFREGLVPADIQFVHGELDTMLIAALMKRAVVTIAPVGFSLPMGIAVNAPTFIIFGGYQAPHLLTDSRMCLDKYGFAAPDPFCSCFNRKSYTCNKSIPNLLSTFKKFLDKQSELGKMKMPAAYVARTGKNKTGAIS